MYKLLFDGINSVEYTVEKMVGESICPSCVSAIPQEASGLVYMGYVFCDKVCLINHITN
jgi:hypothetical protein